jgi:hypothetical protein
VGSIVGPTEGVLVAVKVGSIVDAEEGLLVASNVGTIVAVVACEVGGDVELLDTPGVGKKVERLENTSGRIIVGSDGAPVRKSVRDCSVTVVSFNRPASCNHSSVGSCSRQSWHLPYGGAGSRPQASLTSSSTFRQAHINLSRYAHDSASS